WRGEGSGGRAQHRCMGNAGGGGERGTEPGGDSQPRRRGGRRRPRFPGGSDLPVRRAYPGHPGRGVRHRGLWISARPCPCRMLLGTRPERGGRLGLVVVLLGKGRRSEIGGLWGRLSAYFHTYTAAAIAGSVAVWGNVAASPDWRNEPSAYPLLYQQMRRWYGLILLKQNPTTLIKPNQVLKDIGLVWRAVR